MRVGGIDSLLVVIGILSFEEVDNAYPDVLQAISTMSQKAVYR